MPYDLDLTDSTLQFYDRIVLENVQNYQQEQKQTNSKLLV